MAIPCISDFRQGDQYLPSSPHYVELDTEEVLLSCQDGAHYALSAAKALISGNKAKAISELKDAIDALKFAVEELS